MKILRDIFIAALCMLPFSCTPVAVEENVPVAKMVEISVEQPLVRVQYNATEASFVIESDGDWYAELIDGDWIQSFKREGRRGVDTFDVCFGANPEEDADREARFRLISVQDDRQQTELVLKQAPFKYLIVEEETIRVPSSGGEYIIMVHSNVSWRVEGSDGLVYETGLRTDSRYVTLTVPPSVSFEEQFFELNIITDEEVTFGSAGEVKTISIIQEASEATFAVSDTEIIVEAEDTEARFTIFENTGYSIRCGEGLTYTVSEVPGAHEVVLRFPSNTQPEEKIYKVYIETDFTGSGIESPIEITITQRALLPDAILDFSSWPFVEDILGATAQKQDENRVKTYTYSANPEYTFDIARGETILSGKTAVGTYSYNSSAGDLRFANSNDGKEYIQVNCNEGIEIASITINTSNSGNVPMTFQSIDASEVIYEGNVPAKKPYTVDLKASDKAKTGCRICLTKSGQQYQITNIHVKYRSR